MGCRKISDKGDLVRVVRTPEGLVTVDRSGRMNGRGAYLCRSRECLAKAQKSGALSRALKCPIPEETYAALSEELSV